MWKLRQASEPSRSRWCRRLPWEELGVFRTPQVTGDHLLSIPALCPGRGALCPILSAVTGALCLVCVPLGLIVTGLLSKMGLRLVQACPHVLCSSGQTKLLCARARGGGGGCLPTESCLPATGRLEGGVGVLCPGDRLFSGVSEKRVGRGHHGHWRRFFWLVRG